MIRICVLVMKPEILEMMGNKLMRRRHVERMSGQEKAISSQYPKQREPMGLSFESMNRMIGSKARMNRIMEEGQPSLTPVLELKTS